MLNAFPTYDRHVRAQLHCSEGDIYTARSSVSSFKAGATEVPSRFLPTSQCPPSANMSFYKQHTFY